MSKLLLQSFYQRETSLVARELLGQILCRRLGPGKILRGTIVETEAYLGIDDPACHTFQDRRTKRTEAMYLDGGFSYVYLIYGMYDCLNVVTRTPEHPEAVLIRALHPIQEDPTLKKKWKNSELKTNGPGKLCRALSITRKQNARPLWKRSSDLWIEAGPLIPSSKIVEKPRVGVDYAGAAAQWPLRYYLKDDPFVSKP